MTCKPTKSFRKGKKARHCTLFQRHSAHKKYKYINMSFFTPHLVTLVYFTWQNWLLFSSVIDLNVVVVCGLSAACQATTFDLRVYALTEKLERTNSKTTWKQHKYRQFETAGLGPREKIYMGSMTVKGLKVEFPTLKNQPYKVILMA